MRIAPMLLWRCALASLLLSSAALGDEVPAAGKLDQRVRFINYLPYQVTRIAGTLRSSIQVEFAADEEIVHVAAGNSIAWEVAVKGNYLFLKPRELQGPTNMHVLTQRPDKTQRSYQLEIVAMTPQMATSLKPFFLVKFRYPEDEAVRARMAQAAKSEVVKAIEAEQVLSAHELGGPRNYAYTAQGEATFEPASVYDNGKLTTFEFPDNTDIPAIFLAQTDGSETLVAKSVSGHAVIVHATSGKFVLRRGFEAVCIFNEDYRPEGFDPGTNTVSSRVARVTKFATEGKSTSLGRAVTASGLAARTSHADRYCPERRRGCALCPVESHWRIKSSPTRCHLGIGLQRASTFRGSITLMPTASSMASTSTVPRATLPDCAA